MTQNTSWQNVIKALINLYQLDSLRPRTIEKMPMDDLGQAIRPAGYFNQKAKKIKAFTAFYLQLNGKVPTRDQLLNVWGIGPETADSILLYAYKVASFVIDAYTRRIFVNIGLIQDHLKYHDIKKQFENNLKKDIFIYQEYHALMVTHAKAYYSKKDLYAKDPLLTSAKVNLIK
ncbi:MAG: endonuclease III related protein [Candidatus Magnetoglobus multicellularis str. Araruama]|uniref:Endonuclease III related protein n=1 Tax=Candidatus Magnetoglobus multicellularis str. Araruama TaxID=890399 RepID=A0A1V1PG59_9BACT|nr:MAG: endonuclease III related protein [Candidatus Magnetoglobus multicellularis str. Araruama]